MKYINVGFLTSLLASAPRQPLTGRGGRGGQLVCMHLCGRSRQQVSAVHGCGTRWLCKGSSWGTLCFSAFQGRKGLYSTFMIKSYFFVFMSEFSCLWLMIRIFYNTLNGFLPGNNLEYTSSALVLF